MTHLSWLKLISAKWNEQINEHLIIIVMEKKHFQTVITIIM